jgi:dihydroflavonol-4-reductase
MTLGRPGQAYLLSGRYATILEIAKLFGSITGRPVPERVAPFWLLKTLVPFILGWSKLTNQRPLFTREALSHVELGHPNVSHDKALRDLDYQPRPLEETLLDTWEWLQTRL